MLLGFCGGSPKAIVNELFAFSQLRRWKKLDGSENCDEAGRLERCVVLKRAHTRNLYFPFRVESVEEAASCVTYCRNQSAVPRRELQECGPNGPMRL